MPRIHMFFFVLQNFQGMTMSSSLIPQFYLNPWIYGCCENGNIILLDIKEDAYYLINSNDSDVFFKFISNSYMKKSVDEDRQALEIEYRKISYLLNDPRIITSNPKAGKSFSKTEICAPSGPFEHFVSDNAPVIRHHHVKNILLSGIKSAWVLQCKNLEYIINNLRKCKIDPVDSVQTEKALGLAQVYHYLRPLLPKSRVCLYDSLSFIFFCRYYSYYPTLVFGVISDPFEAHCWVQDNGLILNDSPQKIMQYTPIMTV